MGFLRDKFQAMAAAVAFAEAGEWETAKSLLRRPVGKQIGRPASSFKRPGPASKKTLFSLLECHRLPSHNSRSDQEEHSWPPARRRKNQWQKLVIYGALTAILYAAVFSNADTVLHLFTRGGAYAALPIGAVFVFSFAHGALPGNLWSVLGIEAITKQPEKRAPVPAPRPARRARPRLRLSL